MGRCGALFRGSSVPSVSGTRLAAWRREIVRARIKLAEAALSSQQQRELWCVVDCREFCIKLSGADFEAELEQIDRELEQALRKR